MEHTLYNHSINIIYFCEKLSDTCVALEETLQQNIKHSNNRYSSINTFNVGTIHLKNELAKIKIDEIFDGNIIDNVNQIQKLSEKLFYKENILCQILIHEKFEEFGKNDTLQFLKEIFDILEKISFIAGTIKCSDYCYVERGLFKKEDIYE